MKLCVDPVPNDDDDGGEKKIINKSGWAKSKPGRENYYLNIWYYFESEAVTFVVFCFSHMKTSSRRWEKNLLETMKYIELDPVYGFVWWYFTNIFIFGLHLSNRRGIKSLRWWLLRENQVGKLKEWFVCDMLWCLCYNKQRLSRKFKFKDEFFSLFYFEIEHASSESFFKQKFFWNFHLQYWN
jgi:hypothetical protein